MERLEYKYPWCGVCGVQKMEKGVVAQRISD